MDALSPHTEVVLEAQDSNSVNHYMPQLDEVLRSLAASGRVMHITLAPSRGEWQASFREVGGQGYRVHIKKDIVEALLAALGPRWGESWEEHLAKPSPRPAPKTRDVKRQQEKREKSDFDDDVEDLL